VIACSADCLFIYAWVVVCLVWLLFSLFGWVVIMFVIVVGRWLNCYYVLQMFVMLWLFRLVLSVVDLWFAWLCLLFPWFWGGVAWLRLLTLWLFVIACLLIVLLVRYYELYFMLVRAWSVSVFGVVVVYYLLFWVVARILFCSLVCLFVGFRVVFEFVLLWLTECWWYIVIVLIWLFLLILVLLYVGFDLYVNVL